MELGGKRMRRSTIIRAVVFRDSTIATLQMIKDDDGDDNLETALDVVATHIKKECSMMDYKHQICHTNTSKGIADESAPDTLQQLLRKMSIG